MGAHGRYGGSHGLLTLALNVPPAEPEEGVWVGT